jgi:hypothetical protein
MLPNSEPVNLTFRFQYSDFLICGTKQIPLFTMLRRVIRPSSPVLAPLLEDSESVGQCRSSTYRRVFSKLKFLVFSSPINLTVP